MKQFITLLAALCIVSGVYAASQQPTVKSLNDQIAKAEAEIKRNEQLLSKIKKDKTTTQSELKLIGSRIRSRNDLIKALREQIAGLEKEISTRNKNVDKLQKEVDKLKKQYADMVYAAYKNHLLNNSMTFVFAAKDFDDAVVRIDYMKRYNRMREKQVAAIDSVSRSLSTEITDLEKQRAELNTTRDTQGKEVKSLQKDETTFKQTSSKLVAEEKKVAKVIKQKEKEKQEAQKQLQKIIEEEARKAANKKRTTAEDKQIAALSDKFDQNRGRFPYPVSGGVVIDHFGIHTHPTQKELKINNKGVNIAAEKGAQVRAIFEGTVTRVIYINGLNNCIMINHGEYYSVYSNLEKVSVKANDKVSTNQVIGSLPTTDDNNDYHIHFELWKGTTNLNPEPWFAK